MSELFYVFGIALTVMALVVAFGGMRMESFPSRPVMVGGIALMSVLVVGSAAFAIVLAREEKEHRDEEIAEFRAEEEEAAGEETGASSEGEATDDTEPVEAEPIAADALELTSPEPGDLVFEPDTLEAEAGEVTINYTNPSPVPHNVAIEDGSETVAQGETVTDGASGPATAELEPGEYVFYCSVPSHREAGMVGKLTVK